MRLLQLSSSCAILGQLGLALGTTYERHDQQAPFLAPATSGRNVSVQLFADLEEAARLVDISYCVGLTSFGIAKPFSCLSRCADFPKFELVTTWNTGPLLSDSCGYIALDHEKERIVLAFRGTYSVTNTIVDLSTVPQEYVPYPGSDGDDENGEESSISEIIPDRVERHWRRDDADSPGEPKCLNCTVHMGFHAAWLNTRNAILPELQAQTFIYPNYTIHLIGHSLGGAVAALGALDLQAHGLDPIITTFGEPRIGNANLAAYLDIRFGLRKSSESRFDDESVQTLRYRRVTHVNDPIPLLPLSEWSYSAHAGEIYISKPSLSPDIVDLMHCEGDNDVRCSAGQDTTTSPGLDDESQSHSRKSHSLAAMRAEIQELANEPWGIPTRYKLWQLFFAHRDYFWRLGLCVPVGAGLY